MYGSAMRKFYLETEITHISYVSCMVSEIVGERKGERGSRIASYLWLKGAMTSTFFQRGSSGSVVVWLNEETDMS